MNQRLRQEVAESLDATPDLLPFVPELLADLWALGSSPESIVELLRPLGLPPKSTRVLDLGCGKGAIALTLAQEFGFEVLGGDYFQPFIQEARARAEELGVASLCQFEYSDMRDTIRKVRDFDVAIYAAVGGVLGQFDQCVGQVRRCIRPGGYVVIDDGFLAETNKIVRPGYEHYSPHDETLRQLTAHGDALVREVVFSAEYTKTVN